MLVGAVLRGWGPSTLRFGRRCECLPPSRVAAMHLRDALDRRAPAGYGTGVCAKITSPSLQAKCTAVAASIDEGEGWDAAPMTVSRCHGPLPGGVDFFLACRGVPPLTRGTVALGLAAAVTGPFP